MEVEEVEGESSSPHPSSETDTVGATAANFGAAAATKPKKEIKPIGNITLRRVGQHFAWECQGAIYSPTTNRVQ